MSKKKLYVGCGLTLASQIFKDEVIKLKIELSRDWEIMEFLGTTAGTEIDVYQTDILTNVATCDAFLGIMDEPSWGLGWETREAALLHKPILLVAKNDSLVTRLALATPHFFENQITFKRYGNMVSDVPQLAKSFLL